MDKKPKKFIPTKTAISYNINSYTYNKKHNIPYNWSAFLAALQIHISYALIKIHY